ncbi:hypothetical protein [Lichenifustis flavocetrariae]|uniref:Uncharacterized protein n=1 Tax=Lichenifustis flavocetrariae TaxID=2949735 RepID=A0AA41YRY3_9HYPH|nr:hypothetical protein [Lichenifustis flavocetrariae]MCW6507416.1 hypothetical protein [Lichenifustis flavocetrariae]
MRMVQIRAWLGGQGWFDLTAHRMNPPSGVLMHWSRIVDVPVSALILAFRSVASPPDAERLARILFPLACQALLITAFLRTSQVLCGRQASVSALLVIVLSGFQYGQFVAGRIDHHAPQIVLLVTMVGAASTGLRGGGKGPAFVCALAIALSLGISLENLPFIAAIVIGVLVVWVARGAGAAEFVRGFGLSLATLVPLVAAATIPPSRYTVVAADALSAPHVLFAILGGTATFFLTSSACQLPHWSMRLVGLSLSGLAIGAIVLMLCPGLLASPYGDVDPLVRQIWLAHVTEAMPLSTTIGLHPGASTLILAPLLAGFTANLWAAASCKAEARDAWRLIAVLTAIGLAGAFWEVRVASSAMPLAALGGVWAMTRAAHMRPSGLFRLPWLRTGLCLLPFTPFTWIFVPVPEELPAVRDATAAAQACHDADALAPLANLPPGIVFAPIDAGSHLLVHTGLSVLGAPYHRNNAGNRAVIDGFSTDPIAAESLVRRTGARYVAICPGEAQAKALADYAPQGLAAHLLAGDPPPWLRPVPLGPTLFRVYSLQ